MGAFAQGLRVFGVIRIAMDAKTKILPVWNGPAFPKPHLPKAFSWALGVECLSERFADVPQFHNMKVWFDDHPVDGSWRVTMLKAAASKVPQQVLTVWYSSSGDAQWYLMVYPVEADRRSHVRCLLEEQAFPVVEQWLKAERSEIWLQGDKHLRCIWDRVADRIDIRDELR
ncbi:MAG: hypothetical protein WCK89_19070 [bacterium]